MKSDITEYFGDPISVYTSEQAEEDGILFNVTKLNPAWEKGLFNYVTMTLMALGYVDKDPEHEFTVNVPNVIDLLNQAREIVRKKTNNFTDPEYFFEGTIELPSGKKQQVYIQQNETGKFTIMLPSDY
jgi:hypothetical protein